MLVLLKSHLNVFFSMYSKAYVTRGTLRVTGRVVTPSYQQLKRNFLFPQYNNNDNNIK